MPSLFISRLLLPLTLCSLAHAISFPSDTQSCLKTNSLLLDRFATETKGVDVKHCDEAINAVCNSISIDHYGETDALDGHEHNFVASYQTCQVHLIGFHVRPFVYEQCVYGFQSITIECMYVGVGKDAEEGKQAGVRGVYMHVEGDPPLDAVDESIGPHPEGPGFLVGPPGYFGNVFAEDVSPASGPGTPLPRRRARV